MKTEFDIQLTPKDMFRFNLYHTYTSLAGYLPLIAAVLVIVAIVHKADTLPANTIFLYSAMVVLFVLYTPIMLYVRSRQQVEASPVLKGILHYRIDDEGIYVSQGEADSLLEWAQVYRIVATKSNVLIFSSPRNAFVIPRTQIQGKYEAIRTAAKEHLENYRFKMKES